MIEIVAISTVPAELSFADGHFVENRDDGKDFETNPLTLSYEIKHKEEQNGMHILVILTLMENEGSTVKNVRYLVDVIHPLSEESLFKDEMFFAENGTLILVVIS